MSKGHIITGIDIGTYSIKVLVVEKRGNEWEKLFFSEVASTGLRRGCVVNIDETAKNIQYLLTNVEKECGRRINSAFVNIGGSHLYTISSDGLISVSRADHIISQEDIDRVLQATRAINIPMNEEVLDVFPREFIVDDQKGIRQPLGLNGVRLQAKVVLLCYFQQHFINLTQAVLNARLQIDDVVPSPLAAAESVLTKQQREIGAAVIDIGAATTSLAVFEEGDLIHLAIFPIGSANITNDLAIGLRTDVTTAEDIKKQHGTCIVGNNDKDKAKNKIEISHQSHSLSFTKKNLADIIEPRVSEILDLIQKELKKIGRQELLPGGIVLTGGGAKLPKIKDLAKDQLKLPCQIGVPKAIMGLEEDASLATVVGLIMGSPDYNDEPGSKAIGISFGFMKGFGSKFKKMFRVFIP